MVQAGGESVVQLSVQLLGNLHCLVPIRQNYSLVLAPSEGLLVAVPSTPKSSIEATTACRILALRGCYHKQSSRKNPASGLGGLCKAFALLLVPGLYRSLGPELG